MTFFNMMDFESKTSDVDDYLHLRVDQSKGIDTVPDMKITVSDLNKKGTSLTKHFFNNGYGGITFKINIIIKPEDKWNNKKVLDVIHDWFINMTPVAIVTDAIDAIDGRYIITKNPNRTQKFQDSTTWELEFTTYTPLTIYKFRNDNSEVLKALQKAKKAKKSSSKNKATSNSKLLKCDYKVLTYSKQKKVVKCVKYMQKILKKQKHYSGKIDGWFGKDTKKALKKFQKKYNKTHKITINVVNGQKLPVGKKYISKKIPTDGKVNKATWKALCEA